MKDHVLQSICAAGIVSLFFNSCISSKQEAVMQPEAGASRVEMKIPDNFFPYDSFNHRHYTGIHDSLYVRAVQVQYDTSKALFISIDTGDISGDWIDEISTASGVPSDHIFLTATHTHESPYISRTLAENLSEPEKSAAFAVNAKKALMEAVAAAGKNMKPCVITFGTGNCNVNVNRNVLQPDGTYKTGVNPEGVSDKTVSVIKFTGTGGKPIAYLYSYAVHSTVMLFSNVKDGGMLLSGDIAGAASRYVENQTHNSAVALWLLAPCADQGPRESAVTWTTDAEGKGHQTDLGAKGFDLVDSQGKSIGSEVITAGEKSAALETAPVIKGCTQTITVDGLNNPIQLRLSFISIGSIALFGFPGELVTSVGHNLQKVCTDASWKQSMIVTQCNGSNGYFSDDFGYTNKTFDGTASFAKQGYDAKVIETAKNMMTSIQ